MFHLLAFWILMWLTVSILEELQRWKVLMPICAHVWQSHNIILHYTIETSTEVETISPWQQYHIKPKVMECVQLGKKVKKNTMVLRLVQVSRPWNPYQSSPCMGQRKHYQVIPLEIICQIKSSKDSYFGSMMIHLSFSVIWDLHHPLLYTAQRKTCFSPQTIASPSNSTHQHLDIVGTVSCSKSKPTTG